MPARYLLLILLTSPCFAQAWGSLGADAVVSMNTSSAGTTLTATIANAGTVCGSHCTVGTNLTWGSPGSGLTVGANQQTETNPGAVTLNGTATTYAAGSLNYNAVGHNDADNNTTIPLTVGVSSITDVSVLVGWNPGFPTIANGDDWDTVTLQSAAGPLAVIQPTNGSGTPCIRIEVTPGPLHSACINFTVQDGYFTAMNWNLSTGVATLYLFSAQGALIPCTPGTGCNSDGSATVTSSATGSTFSGVLLGNNENGNNSGTTSYFQNLMLDWTNHPTKYFWTNNSPWAGIVAEGRAIDWTQVGVVGGIPSASWTQAGSTISACGTSGSPVSPSTCGITSALSSCSNQYVSLGSGTFYLSSTILMPSNCELRGQGANLTDLVFSGTGGCDGAPASICFQSGDNNWKGGISNGPVSWSNGYAKGSTNITLASVSNLKVGNPIILDQEDSTSDIGAIMVSQSTTTGPFTSPGVAGPYSLSGNNGGAQRSGYQQEQIVTVTQCDGNTTTGHTCSSGSNITISPGIYMPDWVSALSPSAWWSTSPCSNAGIQNMTVDSTGVGTASSAVGVEIYNCSNIWVQGIRSIDTSFMHVQLQYSTHVTVRNSYFFLTQNYSTSSYGLASYSGSDSLFENNILHGIASPLMFDGPCSGCVVGYNFSINNFYGDANYSQNSHGDHTAGVDSALLEGNIGAAVNADFVHGTHNLMTYNRNYYTGPQTICWQSSTNTSTSVTAFTSATWGSCTNNISPMVIDSFSRFYNFVANVLGTTGTNTTYTSTGTWPVYWLGGGSGAPSDPNVAATTMRWGNVDSATGFNSPRWCGNSSDTGWSTTCSSTTEIPLYSSLSASQTELFNPLPTIGDTGAGQSALPGSFYYTSKPSWWPSSKAWPIIGPDVTGGNVSGVNGTVYTNPAEDCYLNVMGGDVNGEDNVLTFNAATCYSAATNSGGVVTQGTVKKGVVQY